MSIIVTKNQKFLIMQSDESFAVPMKCDFGLINWSANSEVIAEITVGYIFLIFYKQLLG